MNTGWPASAGWIAIDTAVTYLVIKIAIISASGAQLPRTRTVSAVLPAAMPGAPRRHAGRPVHSAPAAHAASGKPLMPNLAAMSCSDSASITAGMMNSLLNAISRVLAASTPR